MGKYIRILIIALLLTELVAILVHQVAMQYLYLPIYILPLVFFAVSESAFLLTIKEKLQWFMVYKLAKMIVAVILMGIYLFKAAEPDLGLVVRFFAYYFVFLGVETYISTDINKEKNR